MKIKRKRYRKSQFKIKKRRPKCGIKGKEVVALDSLCGGQLKVSMEVVEPVPHVLIAGGGHVGMSVSIVCDTLGWQHSVFDVRKEYSNLERYPSASEALSSSVADFLQSETVSSIGRFSDILVMGHDWSVDQDLLIGLLNICKSGTRIGVIGSKTKWGGSGHRLFANPARLYER